MSIKSITSKIKSLLGLTKKFNSSNDYWETRYESGGNSGPGSYGQLAEFKAEILNEFVASNKIQTVIEFGSGDGHQLTLSNYPKYLGVDVSLKSIEQCKELFKNDTTKTFMHLNEYKGAVAELSMSLDVLFHLVENEIYEDYINRLFNASQKYVVIYSSNSDDANYDYAKHVRHRNFSTYIEKYFSNFKLMKHIPNKYPFNGDIKNTSKSDFYFYVKSF